MGLFERVKKIAKDSVSEAVEQSSIGDMLKANDYKQRVADLEMEVATLKSQMNPAALNAAETQLQIKKLETAETRKREEISKLESTRKSLEADIDKKKQYLIDFDDELMFQEFGLYKPRFDFQNVEEYKSRISLLRDREKAFLKSMNERANETNWTVNNSKVEGRKMIRDLTKLIMRAFNEECDALIRKVKFSNIHSTLTTIDKIAVTVSKLGRVIDLAVPQDYISLKKEEAQIAYEYAKFKEEEKEHARQLREQQREAAKLAKEIAEQRKKFDKEEKQYSGELSKVNEQIAHASAEEMADLLAKKADLETKLADVHKAKDEVDYREANQKAGYVYVISNIGSFGNDVYKIGMTRRLDPMERIKELGDASVPFDFDVHALIFSDDAPALEAALHRRFEKEKVNKVNQRREFFHATLEDIKQVVKEHYDKTVEFTDEPDAEQYRISKKLEEQGQ